MSAVVTLVGSYGTADTNPGTGYVDIVPMVTQSNDRVIIVQDPVKATLDGEGKISVELIPSDDDGWVSGPIPYIFREFVDGRVSQWMAYLYAAGPYDIADLVPLDLPPDMYVPVPGPPNVLTVQSVITLEPDQPADVKIYGTSPSQELEFYIPKGEKGDKGDPGSGGGGGVTDHGDLTGLQDDDHPQYLTPVRGAARYEPKGEVAAHEAKADPHPQYSLADHEHALVTATRVFRIYEATSAPTAGNLHVATSGQTRTIRVSKTDIAGLAYTLEPMLPGDGVTITDNPATPPISGFARYVVTSDIIDQGTYWQFTALRTDTSGSTSTTPGTEVRFIPSLSAGIPTDEAALPQYQYQKAQGISGVSTLWQRILTMPYDLPAGVYEVGFSFEWISDVADQTFYARVSRNNGYSWRAYSKKNTDVTQYQTFFYQYPVEQDAGASTTLVEVKSETGVVDVEFAQVWIRRVA